MLGGPAADPGVKRGWLVRESAFGVLVNWALKNAILASPSFG
jgi:hypothetical protein